MPVKPDEIRTKLRYGTPMHLKISDSIRSRLRMSEQKMKDRYLVMSKNEELFQAYIPEKDADAIRRTKRDNEGIPDYRTIEIPYSYAVAMTAHTYYTSVFLSRTPVLQVAGRHGEAETNSVAIESLLNYQVTVGENLLPLFIWLLDPAKYGFGVIGHHWDKELVRIRKKISVPATFLGMPIPGAKPKEDWQVVDETGYEGNRLYNVRPQDTFPDPRVALAHFQKGEFFARYVETPWNEIFEGQSSGRYFNYDVLKRMRDNKDYQYAGQIQRDRGSSAVTSLPTEDPVALSSGQGYDVPVGFVKGHEVYIKIQPRSWGLGDDDRQEIWVFNLTTNGILFGCAPLGELSNRFPFDMLIDEIDGYSIAPKGTLERVKPMNDVITWLVNTHFYNVRQTLNNQLVVDPSMVVMKDLQNKKPGKLIRLKPEMYGKDVRTAIHQLDIHDVTQNHIADVNVFQGFIERVTGVNDSIMGMLSAGGSDRKTATEVRTSTGFGVNRLKTQCEWFSTTGFGPLTSKLISRTQELYTTERKYRIVGDQALLSPTFAIVKPEDIMGFYDYEPVDGSLPVDRFAQANLWQMLLSQVQNYPQIMAQYDMAKIFAWIANLAGIKNMNSFRVVPDQQMLAQQQAGNVVPINATGGTPAGSRTNLNEPRQIPGMGPTG